MLYLISAGLVVLLGVLVLVRKARQDSGSTNSAVTTATRSEPPDTKSIPTPAAGLADDSDVRAHYLWESRRVARRGEARASMLDFFGYLVIVFAVPVAVGAFITVVNGDEESTSGERTVTMFGAVGSVLAMVVIAALFLGFGALVRNSSRSLAISAGVALDSYEPSD